MSGWLSLSTSTTRTKLNVLATSFLLWEQVPAYMPANSSGGHHSYTRGDAYALRAGGLLGAIVALPVVDATGTDNDRIHMAGALVGELAGISFTHSMLTDKNLTLGEGLIISGGELAGLMLGGWV